MKLILSLILAASLAGCGHNEVLRDPEVVIKFRYIVNTIPEDMLAIPAGVPAIDPKTANDDVISNWLLDGEKRGLEIEGKLKAIRALQVQRLKDLESMPKGDVIIK